MSSPPQNFVVHRSATKSRLISLRNLAFSIVVVLFAQILAGMAARGLSRGPVSALWYQAMFQAFLLFLLVTVFAGMGNVLDQQAHPYRAMGLTRRAGWPREVAVGAAVGWALVVAVVGIIAVIGTLSVGFNDSSSSFSAFFINLIALLLAALAEEVAFRGYPFQRLIEVTGPTMAVVLSSVAFGLMHARNPDATVQSVMVTMLSGVLFSIAYLRTRALWIAWGLHFAWNFAMAVIFGLPVSGLWQFSTLVESRDRGPLWLTGGNYGPEASLTAVLVLFAGIWVVVRVTRDYAWRYAQPQIIPGGIPVDIGGHPPVTAVPDAPAIAPQKPADENGLVQIQLK